MALKFRSVRQTKMTGIVASLLCLTLMPFLAVRAFAQVDDFNDGNDTAWTHQDPVGEGITVPFATFLVENGTYRIASGESPAPGSIGPARGASLQQNVVYNQKLFITVDIKVADPGIEQAIGLLAFVQDNPGLGATSGYSLSFQPASQDLVLNKIVNEVPERLGAADLVGVAGDCVRLVFIAENGFITGALFSGDDLINPIALLASTDTTYTSGTAGIFVYSDTDDASGPVDATYDNYRANALTVPPLSLSSTVGGGFQLSWPDWAVHYAPSTRTDLRALPWLEIPKSEFLRDQSRFSWVVDPPEIPRAFFRLGRRQF